jgi:hypothetical protein
MRRVHINRCDQGSDLWLTVVEHLVRSLCVLRSARLINGRGGQQSGPFRGCACIALFARALKGNERDCGRKLGAVLGTQANKVQGVAKHGSMRLCVFAEPAPCGTIVGNACLIGPSLISLDAFHPHETATPPAVGPRFQSNFQREIDFTLSYYPKRIHNPPFIHLQM